MKKFIIRFVLVQCILLLSGYSHQYAIAAQDHPYSAVILKDSNKAFESKAKNTVSSLETTFKLDIAEIEDDKFLSFKGYIKGIHFYSILFVDQTPGHLFGYINSNELTAKPYSELLSNISFVTFQVFRI